MELPEIILVVGVSLVVVPLFFRRDLVDQLIEAINNFRGGPPTPMHPSPADDGRLLRRRARKSED